MQRVWWILGLAFVATGCGSSTSIGGVLSSAITITAYVPATAKEPNGEADFSVFVDSAFQNGDSPGALVQVRFLATSGTPFAGGTSDTLATTGTVVSATQIVGLCPPADIASLTEVTAVIGLEFPSGASTISTTPLARFAPPPFTVTAFGPQPTTVGTLAEDYTVGGSGFGPVGAMVDVEFLLEAGSALCDGGTVLSVQGMVMSPTQIAGTRPAAPVPASSACRIRVTQANGSATSSVPLVSILPHAGSGVFAPWQGPFTDHPANFAVGDLNGDGYPDLVTASSSFVDIHVFMNDQTGTLVPGPVLGASPDRNGARVALGDVDGDGDLDIVRAMYNRAGTALFRNDGAGIFTDTGIALPTRPHLHITMGDLDQDGAADIVVSLDGAGARVLMNSGAGTFTDSGQSLGSGGWVAGLGRFVAGGHLDLAVGSASKMSMYRNDGTGAFTFTGQSLGTGLLRAVAFGDLNGDGHEDVAGAFESGGGRVFLGDGAGTFTYTGQELQSLPGPDEKRTFGIAIADVDGDCDLDVALGHALGSPFAPPGNDGDEIWLNDGMAAFTDSGQRLGTSDLQIALAFADLDRDGDPDLLSARGGGLSVDVYRNPNTP